MRRVSWLLVGLVLLLAVVQPSASLAQQTDAGFEWSVTPIFGPEYRPGAWTPLRVTIRNDGADRRVDVRASIFSTTLDVPGGGEKTTTLYVQLDQTVRVPVALYVAETRVATATLKMNPTATPLVATLRERTLPELKSHSMVAVAAADLPATGAGLSSLAAVVLDERAWNDLKPAQESALRQWLEGGGTLIVEGSAVDTLPSDLRPATSDGAAAFDGATLANQLGYAQPADTLNGARLLPAPASTALLVQDGNPLLVQRSLGSGRVVASAVALDDADLVAWRGLDTLWATLVPPSQVAVSWAGPFATVNTIRDSQVPTYLNNLPALDLPPLRALLILLGVYVLLAGPVTFLILRRFDRMAWAWLTIPTLTLIFAVLAYGFGARQRGSDIIINELAVVETGGDGTGMLHGYVGVFSPVKASYDLRASPTTLFRPLTNPNWGGGGPAPTTGAINARYSNEPAAVRDLAINQWSMEMLAFERPIADAPSVDVQVRLDGDTVTGSVRNTSNRTLNDAVLLVGGQAERLGTLEPGDEKTLKLRLLNNFNQSSISYLLYQKELDAGYQTPRGPDRELLAKTQAIDTALPTGYGAMSPDPVLLAFYDPETPTVSMNGGRWTRSQRTILVHRATMNFGVGEIALDYRWLTIKGVSAPNAAPADFCSTGRGIGAALTAKTNEQILQLPSALANLQPSELRFSPALDGMTDASKITYELYNWQANTWEPVSYREGFVSPAAPAPYLSNGQLRLRLTLPDNIDNGGGWWGCFSPGILIKGVLQ